MSFSSKSESNVAALVALSFKLVSILESQCINVHNRVVSIIRVFVHLLLDAILLLNSVLSYSSDFMEISCLRWLY